MGGAGILPAVGAIPVGALRWRRVNVGGLERWISAAAGGLLLVAAARLRAPRGLPGLLLGAVLIERAALGHCAIYARLGVSTGRDLPVRRSWDPGLLARAAWRGSRVERTVTVARPRDDVYRFWRGPGAEIALPALRALTVAEARQDERIVWLRDGGRRVVLLLRDAPGGRGTEVKLVMDQGGLAGRLTGTSAERLLRAGLRRHEQLLEAGELVAGSA